jgi:hypothetical protein
MRGVDSNEDGTIIHTSSLGRGIAAPLLHTVPTFSSRSTTANAIDQRVATDDALVNLGFRHAFFNMP